MWSYPLQPLLLPITTTLTIVAHTTQAAGTYNDQSFHDLQQKLSPAPAQILEDLDQYDKFWIEVIRTPKPKSSSSTDNDDNNNNKVDYSTTTTERKKGSSCVWSECGIDETDDAYMGDYRDGDEQWYQYRTQNFCANAAYSLYGRRKDESGWWGPGSWGGCTRRHFINSFFTYGGADNLLKAIGVEPVVYYDGSEGDDDDDDAGRRRRRLEDVADDAVVDDAAAGDDAAGDDDDDAYSLSNAQCVEIEYEWEEDNDNEDGSNDGSGDNNEDERHRHLSGSNDQNDGFASTLGCSANGDYIIGAFQSSSCDGNYFRESIATFDEYNAQHASIGCRNIWKSGNEATYDQIYSLLGNSWSCDVRLYPNSCPDPFGEKGRYEYAIRVAAHGGNPMWAYNNMRWKHSLWMVSWALLWLTVAVFAVTYVVKKRKRTKANGGGVKGFGLSVKEDALAGWAWITAGALVAYVAAAALVEKARVAAVEGVDKGKVRMARRRGRGKAGKAKRKKAVDSTLGEGDSYGKMTDEDKDEKVEQRSTPDSDFQVVDIVSKSNGDKNDDDGGVMA